MCARISTSRTPVASALHPVPLSVLERAGRPIWGILSARWAGSSMAEQLTLNQLVGSSSLPRLTSAPGGTPIMSCPPIRFGAPLVLTLIVALVAIGGCSSAAVPSPSASSALPTQTSSATPVVLAPPAPSATPSPTVAIATITPIPGAPDSGVVVQLVALHVRWIPTTLTAPAGKVWQVKIENQDGPPEHHNFVVASGKTVPERIFASPNFNKGIFTFEVPALPTGDYLFICTVHPDVMTGTLTIR